MDVSKNNLEQAPPAAADSLRAMSDWLESGEYRVSFNGDESYPLLIGGALYAPGKPPRVVFECEQAPPAALAVPASARGYADDDRKRIVSGMQSMRDRLGGFLVKTCGDSFDGDIDTMLEAINFMKALRIEANPTVAVPRLIAALEALADYVDERVGDSECRPLENARAAIAAAERNGVES